MFNNYELMRNNDSLDIIARCSTPNSTSGTPPNRANVACDYFWICGSQMYAFVANGTG